MGIIFLFFKEIVYVTFDETQARASGLRTWIFDYLISVLSGIVVIVAIPIVGILLISSLLVLPALTSTQIAKSFRQTIILSPIIGLLTVTVGLLLSLIINSAPGGTIVLSGILHPRNNFCSSRKSKGQQKSLNKILNASWTMVNPKIIIFFLTIWLNCSESKN